MADTIEKPATDAGYDDDFYLWTQQQAAALREAARMRINAPIDWENVAEEIESLGGRDRRELRSFARHIYVHILKLASSPTLEPREGWKREIRAAREQLELILEDSPSLRRELPMILEKDWMKILERTRADLDSFGELGKSGSPLGELSKRGPVLDEVIDGAFFPSLPERGQE